MGLGKNVAILNEVVNGVNTTRFILYKTVIVTIETIPSGQRLITFNSGGWNTRTTKKVTNEILAAYDIPLRVYQKNYAWYIKELNTDKIYNYSDNTELAV